MIKLPTALRAPELADWIEVELIFGDTQILTPTVVRSLISDDLGTTDEWGTAGLMDEEQVLELDDLRVLSAEEERLVIEIEQALLLLERRQERVQDQYPLAVEASAVSTRAIWNQYLDYAFLVLLNARMLLGLGRVIPADKPALLFEQLVVSALKNYLGGEATRFGWPSTGEFTGTFEERAGELARRMGERLQRPLRTTVPQQNDFGLDVAAWRPVDERVSKIVVLCQCGIGANYDTKILPPNRWPKVIDFITPPITALAIPFEEIGPEAAWRSLATDSGVLFDRTRVGRWARAADIAGLAEEISGWIEATLPLLPRT